MVYLKIVLYVQQNMRKQILEYSISQQITKLIKHVKEKQIQC
jgi:hypothetical protein